MALCIPFYEKADDFLNCNDSATNEISLEALKKVKFTAKKATYRAVLSDESTKIAYGLGKEEDLKKPDVTEIGAKLYVELEALKQNEVVLFVPDTYSKYLSEADFAAQIAFGLKLRSYQFLKYKTIQKNPPFSIDTVHIVVTDIEAAKLAYQEQDAIAEGIFLTRDLIHEPPNVLYPQTFAERIQTLQSLGLKVTIMDEKKLAELGMNAILAVGNGSAHKPCMAIVEWMNGDPSEKPIAFVGKGVTFDTGGISLKPAARMDEMKYDMTGAAVVTSMMKVLALRNAKINAIGLVGLAENSPDGDSYRPSDIIKTYSGQTIEVTNTDAEGRVVLSDVLSYAEKNYDPKCIIDLATLTGAIIIALGHEYAGLFSNDDTLAQQLDEAGKVVNEKVWRMPLCDAYDQLIDSKIADVNNAGPRQASSATAAHFLKRFVNNKPWVHLDIAGVSWGDKPHPLSGHVAYGFGIQLLNTFIKNNYEQ
jgi:leucyl aminopeptidase